MNTEHSKVRRLAGALLAASVDQDWPKAQHYYTRLGAECTGEDLVDALMGFCDTFAAHALGDTPEFTKVRLAPFDPDTGSIVADDMPDRAVWAHELLTARIAGDYDAFGVQIDRLNSLTDGFERGAYVSALIQSVALTIRTLPRGYVQLGRPS